MFDSYIKCFQITTATLKASQAMKQVQVEHKEDLVVPFGYQWQDTELGKLFKLIRRFSS